MIAIAVVAHTKRADQAHQLMETVGAQYLAMDNGTYGCNANHVRCWTYLAKQPTQWGLVLEDDAQPIDGFTTHAASALAAAPADIVSFYLGNPTWWDARIPNRAKLLRDAAAEADTTGAHWITTTELLHGVAIAMPTHLIPDMIEHVEHSTQPIDYAIRQWARDTHRDIAFAWPSLVDHADGPTLFRHPDGKPRTQPRKAWQVGTADTWTRTTAHA